MLFFSYLVILLLQFLLYVESMNVCSYIFSL